MATQFKIEGGIELPAPRAPRTKYPFSRMDVGDSFLVPGDAADQARAQNAACWFGRRHGRKFATRKVEGGRRVWRIV